jgi:hypothetical protein
MRPTTYKDSNPMTHRPLSRRFRHGALPLAALTALSGAALAGEPTTGPTVDPTSLTSAVEADVPEGMNVVISKFAVTLYGYFKADMAYDTAKMNNGDFARWVEPSGGNDESQFNITARQTRLGLKVAGPDAGGIKTSGRIEIDFYSGLAANSSQPRMRHAYVNMDWPEHDFSFLAGQTSDVISPLVPNTVNYTVAWWTGDIGFRRNQFRLTKGFATGDTSKFLLQAAATRSRGGEGEGEPGFQGRASYSFGGIGGGKTTVGLSAHSSKEAAGADSNSFNFDLSVPLGEKFSVKGEYFSGTNLDGYAGGIGQGVNAAGTEIDSSGYWAAIAFRASTNWLFNLGYASESPDSAQLDAGMREENSTLWGNANYFINPSTILGFEIGQHETGYVGGDDESGTRFQLAATFKF